MEISFLPRRYPDANGEFVTFLAHVDGQTRSIKVANDFLCDLLGRREKFDAAPLCSAFDRNRDLIERIARTKFEYGSITEGSITILPDDLNKGDWIVQ